MKVFEGKVVSNKMQRTAVIEVTRKVTHPLYKKILKKSKKYKTDTGEFSVSVGDVVLIEETKPVSKDKYFKVSKVLVRAEQVSSVDEKPLTTENTEKNSGKQSKNSAKTVVARKKKEKNK